MKLAALLSQTLERTLSVEGQTGVREGAITAVRDLVPLSDDFVIPETLRRVRGAISLDGPAVAFKATASNISPDEFQAGSSNSFGSQYVTSVRVPICFLYFVYIYILKMTAVVVVVSTTCKTTLNKSSN